MCCWVQVRIFLVTIHFIFFFSPELTSPIWVIRFFFVLQFARNNSFSLAWQMKRLAQYCFRKGTKWIVTNVNKWRQREANEIKRVQISTCINETTLNPWNWNENTIACIWVRKKFLKRVQFLTIHKAKYRMSLCPFHRTKRTKGKTKRTL